MTTLTELLHTHFDHRMFSLNFCCPGLIVDYDFATKKATVQPALRWTYANGAVDDPPLISGVPVQCPRSGGAEFSFPVIKGDAVLLIFTDRSIEEYLVQGGLRTPGDPRSHDLNDAIALHGVPYPFNAKSLAENNDDVLLIYEQKKLRMKKGAGWEIEGDVKGTGDWSIKGDLAVDGNITATGDVKAGTVSLKNHVHTDPQGGNTGAPTP
jgi:hypothetical protein